MERIQSINAARIEWCCADHGMTPDALAREVGIAPASLAKALSGESGLTFKQLRKIAAFFGRGTLFFLEPGPVKEEKMNAETRAQLVFFESAGDPVEVRLDAGCDTVWLSQRQMAEVFETSTDNISLHLKSIFLEGELDEAATTEDSSVVREEGGRRVRRRVKHYNLDAIISVGYRVNSGRAVLFRQWATRTLREHLTRGKATNLLTR